MKESVTSFLKMTMKYLNANLVNNMPEICSFNGMSVQILFRDHDEPHVHIYRRDTELGVVLFDGTLRNGEIERDKLKELRKWMAVHQLELMDCWQKAQKGLHPGKIEA